MNKWFVIEKSEKYYMYGPFDTEDEALKWASTTPNALFPYKYLFDRSIRLGNIIILKAIDPHNT